MEASLGESALRVEVAEDDSLGGGSGYVGLAGWWTPATPGFPQVVMR